MAPTSVGPATTESVGRGSCNVAHPFPEELHRDAISKIAMLLFAPSRRAAKHAGGLARLGATVFLTGNPCVDALQHVLGQTGSQRSLTPGVSPNGGGSRSERKGTGAFCRNLGAPIPAHKACLSPFSTVAPRTRAHSNGRGGPKANARRRILVTVHRREHHGNDGLAIGHALARVAREREDAEIVYVGHTHPGLSGIGEVLRNSPRVRVLSPQDYVAWLRLLRGCHLVLSDSGGAQEEAPWLRKPLIVLREETERPEVVELGGAKLVGSDPDAIYDAAVELLDDDRAYRRMQISRSRYPYGRGDAAMRIARHVLKWLYKSSVSGALRSPRGCPTHLRRLRARSESAAD